MGLPAIILLTLLELQACVFGQKNWAFDCSCFEEFGLPSNPVVLAWAFTAAEATALDYTAVRTMYLNTRKRAPKRSWYVAVLSRSLLLAIAVDIYLEKKEGVPVRSKASQRAGTWEKSEKYKPGSSPSAGWNWAFFLGK